MGFLDFFLIFLARFGPGNPFFELLEPVGSGIHLQILIFVDFRPETTAEGPRTLRGHSADTPRTLRGAIARFCLVLAYFGGLSLRTCVWNTSLVYGILVLCLGY